MARRNVVEVAGAVEEAVEKAREGVSNEPIGLVRRTYRWIDGSIRGKIEAVRQNSVQNSYPSFVS